MGQGKDDSKLTIFTYAQNWLDDLAAQGVSANKLKSHQMMLRVLHKYLEHSGKVDNFKLSDLSPSLITAWFAWQFDEKDLAASTANTRLRILKSYLEFAAHQDPSLEPIYQAIASLKAPEKPKYITPQAIETLLNAIPDSELRDRTLLSVLYETGCRPEELCALTCADVIIEPNGVVQIWLDRSGPAERVIILWSQARNLLVAYLESLGKPAPKHLFTRLGTHQQLTVSDLNELVGHYALMAHFKDMPCQVTADMVRAARAMQLYRSGIITSNIASFLGVSTYNEAISLIFPKNVHKTLSQLSQQTVSVDVQEKGWGLLYYPAPSWANAQTILGTPTPIKLICMRRLNS